MQASEVLIHPNHHLAASGPQPLPEGPTSNPDIFPEVLFHCSWAPRPHPVAIAFLLPQDRDCLRFDLILGQSSKQFLLLDPSRSPNRKAKTLGRYASARDPNPQMAPMAGGGGVPWGDRARVVGAQIRSRFRVGVAPVDRRWLWRRGDGRVASEAVRQWTERVRSLWQREKSADQISSSPGASQAAAAAKPSSSALRFYRKKVGKEVDGIEDSVIFRSLQALAVPLIGNACHIFMHGLNSVQIYGAEKLQQALQERPKGKPLLTVSNHVAAMDDPFVIASILPPSVMSVKVLPVSRGDGIYQKGMDMALSKLNNGGWVHIFPEGSRSKDGGKTIAPAKRGVGRLVMDADSLPVVIPFVHTGMQDIMPVGKRIPRAGKRVIVVVGDPINFDDLIIDNSDETQHISRGILYDKATERIGQRLQELKAEVDRLAAEQKSELQHHHARDTVNYGTRLWQQVDWEAFGIESSMLSPEPSDVQEPLKKTKPILHLESEHAKPELHLEPEQAKPELHPEQCVPEAPSAAICSDIGVPLFFRHHTDPSELMGFAACGLLKNGRFMEEEGYRELQRQGTMNMFWGSQANNTVL
uniref:Phospholipid/glycerol acyltransferase domain-containing protein n=1 Tax=Oryza meridionalis TaxID=40149 RepID=A0A0E0CCK6_9ORYZ